jgi:hypothetical protein
MQVQQAVQALIFSWLSALKIVPGPPYSRAAHLQYQRSTGHRQAPAAGGACASHLLDACPCCQQWRQCLARAVCVKEVTAAVQVQLHTSIEHSHMVSS